LFLSSSLSGRPQRSLARRALPALRDNAPKSGDARAACSDQAAGILSIDNMQHTTSGTSPFWGGLLRCRFRSRLLLLLALARLCTPPQTRPCPVFFLAT